jgi:hypothetical protein
MTDMIEQLLDKHKSILRNKSIKVIARYVKIKLHIDMSPNAMQQKVSNCLSH